MFVFPEDDADQIEALRPGVHQHRIEYLKGIVSGGCVAA
jgi:hypothetical protein